MPRQEKTVSSPDSCVTTSLTPVITMSLFCRECKAKIAYWAEARVANLRSWLRDDPNFCFGQPTSECGAYWWKPSKGPDDRCKVHEGHGSLHLFLEINEEHISEADANRKYGGAWCQLTAIRANDTGSTRATQRTASPSPRIGGERAPVDPIAARSAASGRDADGCAGSRLCDAEQRSRSGRVRSA